MAKLILGFLGFILAISLLSAIPFVGTFLAIALALIILVIIIIWCIRHFANIAYVIIVLSPWIIGCIVIAFILGVLFKILY